MHLLKRAGVTDPSYKVFPATRFPGYTVSRWQPVGIGFECCFWALEVGRWMLVVESL